MVVVVVVADNNFILLSETCTDDHSTINSLRDSDAIHSQLTCTDLLHTATTKTAAAEAQFIEHRWSVFSQ